MLSSPLVMRVRTFLFITALLLCHLNLWPQALTKQLPLDASGDAVPQEASDAEKTGANAAASSADSLPDAPGFPIAEVVPAPPSGAPVRFQSDRMEKHGNVYSLTGHVRIDYKSYTLLADKAEFDQDSSNAEAEGHLELEGGPDDEVITADHGTMNLDLHTGQFYNVVGTVGARPSTGRRKLVYTTDNPFIFTGRVVIKEGPLRYRVIDGTMTSCRLPRPDWRILSSFIEVSDGKAKAKNSLFKLLGMPVLYLPYVTHPVDTASRQSGLLIPIVGDSNTTGIVVGDLVYWDINRSTDATFGTEYFSMRGWSPRGEMRYHGQGEDFANFHFVALFDRGLPPNNLNQGGVDVVFNGRRDFDPDGHTRLVAAGEYLSSYVYREAFSESFALAVASEVDSAGFLTHNEGGFSESLHFDRYQNFQGITQVGNGYYTPQIRILHLPTIDLDSIDRNFESTPVRWGFVGSFGGVSRSEPDFSSGTVGRFDLYPHLSMPLHLAGWTFRPEAAARETFYTKSQIPTSSTPLESSASLNRKDLEAGFEIRPPALVRDFRAPWMERIFGSDVRHTIEPRAEYKFVAGIDDFSSVPRFDAMDVASDTNEVDYALTQRLFLKHLHPHPCTNSELPAPINGIIYVPYTYRECGGDTSEWISWTVGAKYFFDPSFGGAVSPFRRNVLDTTLDLTGVAFLGGPRHYSPIISRLKVRTSELMDIEWDADYDIKEGRMDASNIFADYRRNGIFGSVGYSTLQALNASFDPKLGDQVTKYSLLRLLGGFGNPARPGLSAGVSAGYDVNENALQYGGIQTAYNWDCCGVNVEYRRLALGSVRNENQYSFSFTLAGIGQAGNLRHAEQIF
ncbi:MAG TPA: LPS assembly protein LptD [Acidobacteriaceae bacterium]|nr:LPS assembly protein LptD [Acidobacteriaceae bacterium]